MSRSAPCLALGTHISVFQCVAVWDLINKKHSALFDVGDPHNVYCVAVCCSVLQCVAVCCSVLQCVALCCKGTASIERLVPSSTLRAHQMCIVLQNVKCVAVWRSVCSVLQCVAVCCSVGLHA